MPDLPAQTADAHRQFSVQCFNQAWDYIEMSERTAEENETMLLLAHASLWHWTQRDDCKPVHQSIGYWQLSRVHALVPGLADLACHYARKCINFSETEGLAPFYLGYGYEALARAEQLVGNPSTAQSAEQHARDLLNRIEDREAREILERDLNQLKPHPAYGDGAE